jgi:feruloyl esterase
LTRIAQLYVSNTFVTTIDPASYIPASKFAAVAAAAVAACDARDGVRDEIIDEPHKCTFDPSVLQCTGAESDSCLTALQVVALKKIYGGLRGGGGEQLYPGFLPGGEAGPRGWAQWIAGPSPTKSSQHIFGTQGNANLIFQNQAYDYRQFNADRDVKAADDLAGRVLNAIDADLRAFRQRGSKLIIYHGWSDAAIPPAATTEYYRNVAAKMGQKTVDGFLRLYMVPGMQHCGGGPGADSFGVLPSRGLARRDADPRRNLSTALERWVEHDSAPSAIISTKYKTGVDPRSGIAFTRLLCPYPQVAKYKGSGVSNEATNFVCKAPEK